MSHAPGVTLQRGRYDMAVDLTGDVRLVRRFSGMRIVGVFPAPREIREAQWDLLKGRFVMERMGRMKDRLLEARVAFVDKVLKNVEGLMLAEDEEVTRETPGWKEFIPANVKSIWASIWEEASVKVDGRAFLRSPTRLNVDWCGQDVLAEFPPMVDLGDEIRALLKGRYIIGRDTDPDRLLEAREAFVSENLRSVENLTVGDIPLTTDTEDWISHIPLGVVSGLAQYFEEGSALSEDEEKN